MWEYLALNLKADVSILVLLNLRVYGNWHRHATQSSINQTGTDFVTEISFCKTPVVEEKRLVFRGRESAREII